MLDFQSVKQSFPIQDAIPFLGLTVKQYNSSYRGSYSACNGGNDRSLVVTPDKNAYFCFVAQRGGDVIALVSHILKIGMREAAQKIADHIRLDHVPGVGKMVSVPQEPTQKEKATPTATASPPAFGPLTYLVYEHEQVQALGLDPATAERLGIGFANKGLMRGKVAIPLYDHTELAGYIGIVPSADIKIPNNLRAP